MTENYRQIALTGFDTIELLREYLVSHESNQRIEGSRYDLTPDAFLDAIENRIDSVELLESSWFLGAVYFDTSKPGEPGRRKAVLKLSLDSPHDRQAETLVHEMVHIDRYQEQPRFRSSGAEGILKDIKDFDVVLPRGRYMLFLDTIVEEKIAEDVARSFYESHTTLAQLALRHVWRLNETQISEESNS